jgi:iron(II)-dependent oxidoreductase
MALSGEDLACMLADARQRTLSLITDLSDAQLMGPCLAIVNPLLWEIGHVAWFQERWVLRHLRGAAPVRGDGDRLYNSAQVAHTTRWDLPLPDRADTLKYMQEVLDRALERLGPKPRAEETYFYLLALYHEDMHAEAFVYTRQTLGYPAPNGAPVSASQDDGPWSGDVEVPAGTLWLGSFPGTAFVFDNEKWAHPVNVAAFHMARSPVTNGEFACFVQDGGYLRRELWNDEGWTWREQAGAEGPVYWQKDGRGRWLRRSYDQIVPLRDHLPVLHVNWHEANAYCRWAGRRLPTEAEWELAAAGPGQSKSTFPWGDWAPQPRQASLDLRTSGPIPVNACPAGDSPQGARQLVGNVWEWTSSTFEPYPGFSPDPYQEYSEPWFGTRRVLRGGCFATRSRLIRNNYRNFYTPDRRDVLAGFRTCAIHR